ncbi:hypothetical protein FNV43_RR00340 [Rhamnella rubrinervis]|uniref:Uncharacterized protein n=1 Tax=Rhamnella rubrinervis TaxID=2594499 RepID=A0A8K0HQE6_9ROSA|nr:hypothetical protein FNV43_RR00340 [Rhamnella rubrinervis]
MSQLVSSLLCVLRKRSSAWEEKPIVEPSSKKLRISANLASSSGAVYQDIGVAENSIWREIVQKRLEVALEDLDNQQTMANYLAAQSIMVIPAVAASSNDEVLEEFEDPKEHLDLEDEDLWNCLDSD